MRSLRRVIIESPYAGDIARNTLYARLCLKDSILRGEAPLASHLLYPQVLDEASPHERELGIQCGLAWLQSLGPDALIIYSDLGISPGMQRAWDIARTLSIVVEHRSIPDWEEESQE